MAFEGLTERLSKVFKGLKSKGKLSEKDVREVMREVKNALLEADVNFKTAKEFAAAVSERAIGADVMQSLTPAQQVIDIVREELTVLMGTEEAKLRFSSKPPTVIMMCGLQGAGKTTHAAKLAKHLRTLSRRPLIAACDVYRPAAIEQLKTVGEQAGAKVYDEGQGDPVAIAANAVKFAKDGGYDVLIIDTAGRLHIDETLMNELKRIVDAVPPDEILLTVDSMTGQDAVNVAKAFDEALPLTGVVLTKLDGDSRGGAALSVRAVTGKPIKFAGIGEKLDDLEVFHPERMASRILGMGDVLSLIDKAKMSFDDEAAIGAAKSLMDNKFDMNDLLVQFAQIEKMGSLKSIVSMLPGVAGKISDDDIDEKKLPRTKAIILSMTKRERERPQIIDAKRKRRIAAGSGVGVPEVNQLLKQYDMMKDMMRKMGKMNTKKKARFLSGLGVQ
ncbi:MAG: signal recognition particle protein [Oscillospiraceae bacterium]|jgi:signal recognition particle subunit SRP54|nr:signal recognition particle protein [Oscillospiraceae bacterium]